MVNLRKQVDVADATRVRTGSCVECGDTTEIRGRGAVPKRCGTCKSKPPECRSCGGPVPMVWRGGPRAGWVRSGYYCSEDCKPRCSIAGCERPMRKRDWCANHYTTWKQHGDPDRSPSYTWGVKTTCNVCNLPGNSDQWSAPSRSFCSARCKRLWLRHKGNVPTSVNCRTCGAKVSLLVSTEHNSRRRSDTAFCADCAPYVKPCVTTAFLAARDGAWCRLCDWAVDMAVTFPDPMSPSVDHIVPRALGGEDIPSNVQLAHFGCNSRKRHLYIG